MWLIIAWLMFSGALLFYLYVDAILTSFSPWRAFIGSCFWFLIPIVVFVGFVVTVYEHFFQRKKKS